MTRTNHILQLAASTVFLTASIFPLPAQEQDAQPVQAAAAEGPTKMDEVLSYRFRLSAADAAFNLSIRNNSDQPGQSNRLQMDPNKGPKAHFTDTTWLKPGESVLLKGDEIDWERSLLVYVAASRRLSLELVHQNLPQGLRSGPNLKARSMTCSALSAMAS